MFVSNPPYRHRGQLARVRCRLGERVLISPSEELLSWCGACGELSKTPPWLGIDRRLP